MASAAKPDLISPMRLYLEQSGRKGRDIALEIGCTPQAVYYWCSGHRYPHDLDKGKLERILGIPAEDWIAYRRAMGDL